MITMRQVSRINDNGVVTEAMNGAGNRGNEWSKFHFEKPSTPLLSTLNGSRRCCTSNTTGKWPPLKTHNRARHRTIGPMGDLHIEYTVAAYHPTSSP